MHARGTLIPLVTAMVLGVCCASVAFGQAAARGSGGEIEPASSKVIDGVTYYYDAEGNLLYKDDPVHYTPPRRFYYRNGGWVMARSNYGHGHSRYANTGLHKRRGQSGQNTPADSGTGIRKTDARGANAGNKAGPAGGGQVRKAESRGRAGKTTAGQVETTAKTMRKDARSRAGQGAQTGNGAQARKAGSRCAASATPGGQNGAGAKAGQAASSGRATKSGKPDSSPARGASGGKHGGGKAAGSGASRGGRGPK